MLKLVIFDMDGVIFEGKNFWLDFHRRMGTERQAWELWDGLAKTDYLRLSQITADRLWAGRSAALFFELLNDRTLVPGVDKVFYFLRQHGIATTIISSGPYQLAERAQEIFKIDAIRANRLYINKNNIFTGEVEVQVNDNDKARTAFEVMSRLGAGRRHTAVIGDTASDIGMAALADLSIAYDTRDPSLLGASCYQLPAGKLSAAIDLLYAHHISHARN